MFAAVNVGNYSDKLIHHNVMNPPLHMQHQILSLVAEKLPLVDYDTNFPREPTRSKPEMLRFMAMNRSIDHKDGWNALDGLSGGKLLVAFASVAPTSRLVLPFDTGFENLRERGTLNMHRWFHCLYFVR